MKVIIYGYENGFNKVQFNQYLRKNFGYNIHDAKVFVDNILNGTEVSLEVNNSVQIKANLTYFGLSYRVDY